MGKTHKTSVAKFGKIIIEKKLLKNKTIINLKKEVWYKILLYLDTPELFPCLNINKQMNKKLKSEFFVGFWTLHCFHDLMTKTGLTGLINLNLQKID
jgi:hypothetical protein